MPRSTAATSARTSAPGTAASRSAARESRRPRRGTARLARRWLELADDELRTRYERLYFPRKDPRFLRRNALVALGNTGDPEHRPAVEAYAENGDPLLREHAAVGSRAARRGALNEPGAATALAARALDLGRPADRGPLGDPRSDRLHGQLSVQRLRAAAWAATAFLAVGAGVFYWVGRSNTAFILIEHWPISIRVAASGKRAA